MLDTIEARSSRITAAPNTLLACILSFRVLDALASLVLAYFFTFNHSGIPGKEAVLSQ